MRRRPGVAANDLPTTGIVRQRPSTADSSLAASRSAGLPPPKRPPPAAASPRGQWYCGALNPQLFEEAATEVRPGLLLEFKVCDAEGNERGNAIGLIGTVYEITPSGLCVSAEYYSSQSPQLHEWFNNLADEQAGLIHVHLCRGRHTACAFNVAGTPITHSDTWRVRDAGSVEESWVWDGPAGEDTPQPGDGSITPPSSGSQGTKVGPPVGPAPRGGRATGPAPGSRGVERPSSAQVARSAVMDRVAALGAGFQGEAAAAALPGIDGVELAPSEASVAAVRAPFSDRPPLPPPVESPPTSLATERLALLRGKLQAAKSKAMASEKEGGQRAWEAVRITDMLASRAADAIALGYAEPEADSWYLPRGSNSGGRAEVTIEADGSIDLRGSSSLDVSNPFREVSQRQPGRLFSEGLRSMERFLAPRSQGGGPKGELRARAVEYLTTVFAAAHREPGLRNERELRTLSEGLDFLASGHLGMLGDLLMQRFKAVETSLQEGGNWEIARHLEVIPPSVPSAVSEGERAAALTMRLRSTKAARVLRQRGEERSGSPR